MRQVLRPYKYNENTPNILIKFETDLDFIAIRTYCRRHGASRRFLANREKLADVLNGSQCLDSDLDGFLECHIYNDRACFRLYVLESESSDTLDGYKLYFEIPVDVFRRIILGERIRYLYKLDRGSATLDFTHATRTLREVLRYKWTRRAFVKAIRDGFRWSGETVTFYNDTDGFYFRTSSGFPRDGGLIESDTIRNGYHGVRFTVHT